MTPFYLAYIFFLIIAGEVINLSPWPIRKGELPRFRNPPPPPPRVDTECSLTTRLAVDHLKELSTRTSWCIGNQTKKMITLKLDDETAMDIYPSACDALKTILEKSAEPGFFSKTIEERCNTFEKCWPVFKAKKLTDPDYIILQNRKESELTTSDKLEICAKVWQEDFIPDYSDLSQYKYYGWVEKTASGWVFVATFYDYTGTDATVGPRVVMPSRERAKSFIITFLPLISKFLTVK